MHSLTRYACRVQIRLSFSIRTSRPGKSSIDISVSVKSFPLVTIATKSRVMSRRCLISLRGRTLEYRIANCEADAAILERVNMMAIAERASAAVSFLFRFPRQRDCEVLFRGFECWPFGLRKRTGQAKTMKEGWLALF